MLHALASLAAPLAGPSTSLASTVNIAPDDHPMASLLIVASEGRGGSTVLAHALGLLVAMDDPETLRCELFGQNAQQMRKISDPSALMSSWFDGQRKNQPHARFVGFKWKPLLFTPEYVKAWDWAASHHVRVLHLTRNALDAEISIAKHHTGGLGSRCTVGDAACVASHEQRRVRLNTTNLVQDLELRSGRESQLMRLLARKRIAHAHLEYADLFAGETSARHHDEQRALTAWNKALSFLDEPRAMNYSRIAEVLDRTGLAPTSRRSQCDALLNVAEVRTALAGTRFEGLLEC